MTTPFPFVSAAVLTAAQMNAITTLPINDQTASYTALVGDVGKRIIMNVATANTLTINDSIFAVGDTIFCANKGAGTTTITAGAGVTINGTLTVAQHGGGTLVALSASTFTFFSGGGGNLYGTATGGIGAPTAVTISSVDYEYLTFNATGTLTVTKSGLFDVWLGAGGGSGGGANNALQWTGGGGAGGIAQATVYLSADTTVTIGAGGAGSLTDMSAGSYTSLDNTARSISVVGGGFGSGVPTSTGAWMRAIIGGSGGGGGASATNLSNTGNVSVAPSITGYAGGNGVAGGSGSGGGGGGSTAVGTNSAGAVGGNGGAGYDVSAFIGSTALYKAAGGGGAGTSGGTGGSSIGGSRNGGTAAANTASGGAGSNLLAGGSGGSGIAYIRWEV